MAPSKTYNIAGLHASVAVIQDEDLRNSVKGYMQYLISTPSILSLVAAKAAYEHGDEWLSEQIAYLQNNRDMIGDAVDQGFLGNIRWHKPEGTFLAWLDCRELGVEGDIQQFFVENAKVCLNDGCSFGEAGEGFLRLNFGCTQAVLKQALEKMAEAIRNI
jgi:cystathionine beta-lyase